MDAIGSSAELSTGNQRIDVHFTPCGSQSRAFARAFALHFVLFLQVPSYLQLLESALRDQPDNLHFRKLAIETCDNLGYALIVGSATEIC